ncbi:MBL fold metallo-hydrolase [Saccharopolyspora hordei]
MAGLRSIELGDLRVSYVPDGVVGLKPRGWFPGTTDDDWRDRAQHLDGTGQLVASIGGLLVERGSRALLVDAGFGPSSRPDDPANPAVGATRGGALLEDLAALGRSPEDVEAVAITHLHTDHIGWVHEGVFTTARVLVAEPEWQRRDQRAADVTDAVLAGLEAQLDTVRDGQEVFPGVRVRYSAGHTPGHASYVITSGGQRLIAFGDALHSAVQIAEPGWPVWADVDREEAVRTRRDLVRELQRPATTGFGVHFADVQFGRAVTGSGTTRWQPLP